MPNHQLGLPASEKTHDTLSSEVNTSVYVVPAVRRGPAGKVALSGRIPASGFGTVIVAEPRTDVVGEPSAFAVRISAVTEAAVESRFQSHAETVLARPLTVGVNVLASDMDGSSTAAVTCPFHGWDMAT